MTNKPPLTLAINLGPGSDFEQAVAVVTFTLTTEVLGQIKLWRALHSTVRTLDSSVKSLTGSLHRSADCRIWIIQSLARRNEYTRDIAGIDTAHSWWGFPKLIHMSIGHSYLFALGLGRPFHTFGEKELIVDTFPFKTVELSVCQDYMRYVPPVDYNLNATLLSRVPLTEMLHAVEEYLK